MPDIPQEVREAAADYHAKRRGGVTAAKIKAGLADDNDIVQALHTMFLAGKRAGMERAAEELRQIYVDCDAQYLEWNNLPPVGDEARNFAFDISRYALAALKEADQ